MCVHISMYMLSVYLGFIQAGLGACNIVTRARVHIDMQRCMHGGQTKPPEERTVTRQGSACQEVRFGRKADGTRGFDSDSNEFPCLRHGSFT